MKYTSAWSRCKISEWEVNSNIIKCNACKSATAVFMLTHLPEAQGK